MKHFAHLLLGLLVTATACAGDWPAWRGPQGTGIADEKNVPVTWSQTENVKWKVPLNGPGNSTPIVSGGKVFLSAAPANSQLRGLLCFDRRDGKELWKREVECEIKEATHGTNPYCASSPVTDGNRIFVWHGSAGMFCYDLDGKELWRKDLGKFEHIWGYGSSPMLVDDLLVLNAGPGLSAFVVALKCDTGDEVWRREFPEQKSLKADEFRGSWSTPVLYSQGGQNSLLLSLPQRLYAVHPKTGDELWNCSGLTKLVYTSPVIAGDTIIAMGGFHSPALADHAKGGKGDITEQRTWYHDQKNPQRIGSGVAIDGYLYIVNEPGIAACLDAKTGEKKWEQRLGKTGSWSSICYVDGRLYVPNMNAVTFVLKPNPEACEIIAENDLGGEMMRASLAISDGQIFLRTYENLYCVEAKQ